jgi:glutaredoxin
LTERREGGSLEQTTGGEDDEDMAEVMAKDLPILYVKEGCGWCSEAIEFLDGHGVGYRLKDVTDDATAFSEMQKKSGQTKAPTLDWHGKILADFGVDELVPFLQAQNVKLEDS